MTTLTLELPNELVERLEEVATQTGRPLVKLVAETLAARFAPEVRAESESFPASSDRIRLRPVRLTGWPADTTFRREEIHGDDAR